MLYTESLIRIGLYIHLQQKKKWHRNIVWMNICMYETAKVTRMHSSRMRTARLLPISPSCTALGGVSGPRLCTWSRGMYLPRGVPAWGYLPRGVCLLGGMYLVCGVYLVGGCTCPVGEPTQGSVPDQGVYLPGECTWSWGAGGVPVLGDVPGPGGTCLGGYTCMGGVPSPGGGCTCLGGVPAQGVHLSGGVPARGSTCPGTPPVNRMTNRCKNITLPQTNNKVN